jgi:hypothetical protein
MIPLALRLSQIPKHFAVTLTTTPQRLRDIIGANQLSDIGNRAQMGGELRALSGDILWGETAATCDLPKTAATTPWAEPIAPILDLYFRANAGTVTTTALIYLG